ncbi:MAG: hypothetical protein WAM53_19735 [Terrimicrobiaceae bacterium]
MSVEFIRAHSRDKAIELTLPGNIVAVHQTTINALATGYIARWIRSRAP